MTFLDGTTTLGAATLNGTGRATFSTGALAVGSHAITAVYGGNGTFSGSTSAVLTQTVNAARTTTAVASSANPSVFGQTVTFTATVSVVAPGAGTPTGTVTFSDGTTTLGTGTLNGARQATFSTGALAVGSHAITAAYGGSASFSGSTSAILAQTVNPAATTTAIASSINPSAVGQTVTFTATVTSASGGTPTGTVTFRDGTVTLGTGVLDGAGQATFGTSTLTVGSHAITAVYGGSTSFSGSTSAVLTQTVNAVTTTTAVVSSPNPSVFGQMVTFTATVTSASGGTPTGTVAFQEGTTTLGTGVLDGAGQATFGTSTLTVGSHAITAVYGGSTSFGGSTSAVLTQTVNAVTTTTTVVSSPNPSVFGQMVTFTATVTSASGGTPTGTVAFQEGTTTLGTGTLNGAGQATFGTSTLAVGSQAITAVYGGSTSFGGSTSAVLTQTVNAGATTTAVVSSVNPSALGQTVTFTATVSVVAPGAGTPTGTVAFRDGTTTLGTGTLTGAGQAAFSTGTLAVGSHTITAVYGGDTSFSGSTSAAFTQTVSQSSCTGNPIVVENCLPGNPSTEWDISGAGDPSIQGFATEISANHGDTVFFKIDTNARNYVLDIYRMGYYGGMGARHVDTISPSAPLPQSQPACLTSATTGLIDCGNWAVSASWTVPANATSGIYFAKVTRTDTGGASHIVFIVRDDASTSALLFQTSDTTWQAYNNYGGNSLYTGGPGTNPSRAYKVSYNRPFNTRTVDNGQDWVFNAEYPMVRWLEANGYDVSYFTCVDADRHGSLILNHEIYMSVGHDEYWSGGQRGNVEAARGAGVHLAFFSGNEIFWKTRWETSTDGSSTPYRTLVSYKETHASAVIDPADPPTWTGTWRDPRFSPPADGGRPENALSGNIFMVNDGASTAIQVPDTDGKMRFWRNTSIATLASGATATLPDQTLGYEWDEDLDNGVRPAGVIRMSTTTVTNAPVLQDYGSTYASGTATHHLTLYRHPSGALVFGAGTVQWSWGLDGDHDRGSAPPDQRMQQATVNLLADMGVQPATLQSGLVPATASTDATPPTSTITSPAAGANVPTGSSVTITGTATDAGGGVVGGVEVSVDGGTTWHPATGRGSWSYIWTTPGTGATMTLKSRAVDDSGNLETPSAGVTVTVGSGSTTCPCSVWSSTTTPTTVDDGDPSAVELGVKFQSSVNGSITALRFYKASTNTGTHIGNLWTSGGTRLATATFTNETASGWQQVTFASPVPITANTTYVASYFAPNGHYSDDQNYFTTAVTSGPLTFLADGTSGPNGVYVYGADAFPTQGFNASNYWIDVVFSTTASSGLPTVAGVSPASGAAGVDPGTSVTATFSNTMDQSTITTTTFQLLDASNAVVPATVSYNASTQTATLTPTSPLASAATYTAIITGGPTGVSDTSGNTMAANFTWSFTTGSPASCPCTVWSPTTTPATVDSGDGSAVELGVRFQSSVNGYITGVRFYKASTNTGTHVGNLWTSGGTRLAMATFTGETASGWQQVTFGSPVPITANTTYVASYFAPSGHYSVNENYFVAAVSTGPLTFLADGASGPNGVFVYGADVFPNGGFNASNYWVDVVFATTVPPGSVHPMVTDVSPPSGASYVELGTSVTATFDEAMDPSSITSSTFQLLDASNAVVPASVSYNATTQTATLVPTSPLGFLVTYRPTLTTGVKDSAGNPLAAPFTWSFTTAGRPPGQGPGGPVLVVTTSSNPFTTYYTEILLAEGLNLFDVADIGAVTSTTLAAYDVLILGQMSLTPAQVQMLSDWVNAGGNLIAMRPDKQLAPFLGLVDAGSTLSNAYLQIDTSTPPGAGIVSQTIQFHGTADRYTLNGATAIATLYSSASAPTSNPAVTVRSVGANGGQAAAFTYDLARSVVYTRQGNAAWAGQERDGIAPIRPDDLYFGDASFDVEPDWIDLDKVAIPQADEQQRLLANLILLMNTDRRPLPRFWYLPRGLKAAVVMTGDDHANGGTAGRFDQYIAASPAGCSVDNWECVRSTSYIYVNQIMTDAIAASYNAKGFEIGLHVLTGCADWTPSSLASFFADQLASFAATYPSLPPPTTNRTHCLVWSDWATHANVELSHNIGLETNYYYWPPAWILDRPGLFTGSGMPMRFADLDGTLIDVYQATTQMTDESQQSYPFTVDTLLDNALGAQGYYGVFTANMHTDSVNSAGSDAIVASAQARGVPIVSSRQMLQWLDGRNSSSLGALSWDGANLSFTIAVAPGANGLQVMVPATSTAGSVASVTQGGSPVTFTIQTIKGVSYATFQATTGGYVVTYAAH